MIAIAVLGNGKVKKIATDAELKSYAQDIANGKPIDLFETVPMQVKVDFHIERANRPLGVKATKTAPVPSEASDEKRGPGRPKLNVGPCTVPGCDRPQKTRKMCAAHYQAWNRGRKEAAEKAAAPAPAKKKIQRRKKPAKVVEAA